MRWFVCACLIAGCVEDETTPPGEVRDVGAVFAVKTPKLGHTFQVTNRTGHVVKILGESHSCTCTKIEVEKRALKPGESIPLTMEVKVPGARADMDLSCMLRTDDPKWPEWTYHLRFNAYPSAQVEPLNIDLRRADSLRDAPAAYLDIFDPVDAVLPPIKVVEKPKELDVVIGETPEFSTMPGGIRRARFPITLRPNSAPTATATFARPLTLVTLRTGLSAMVVWDSVGPLAATPPALTFGALSTDASPKRLKVVVKSTKGQSFRLTAWDGGDAAVQVEPGSDSSLPKPSHDAELIFDPSRSNGRHMLAGTATFTTDLDGAGVCSVRWSAFPRENTKSVSK